MMWRWIVKAIGGLHEWRRWTLLIHDSGVLYARDRVIVWEWRL
jgi:hypothetical protein